MILYKYYGFNAGLEALKSSRLGFRKPKSFNDPFELSFLDNASGPEVKLDDLENKINSLKESVVILSLTRTPTNPLMWAHYGEEHTGFVVGYDVSTPFLMSEEYNIVPVDRGDVVYTNTKTLHKLNSKTREQLHAVYQLSLGLPNDDIGKSDIENLARKIFLTKHASWVYEEEVRVVKSPVSVLQTVEEQYSDPMRRCAPIIRDVAPGICTNLIEGLMIYEHNINIKEIYLGVRNPLVVSNALNKNGSDNFLCEKAEQQKWKVRSLKMARGSWGIEVQDIDYDVLSVPNKTRGLINSFSMAGSEVIEFSRKVLDLNIENNDRFEITNWNGEVHIMKNDQFV